MKVLVPGGEGYIGANLVERLLADGHEVHLLARGPGGFLPPSVRARVVTHYGDFADTVFVASALAGCEVVFHLISTTIPQTAARDPAFDIVSNLVPTVRMLDAAAEAGVRRVVFVSSGGTVYGVPRQLPIPEDHPTEPICSYGATKLAIEKFLHVNAYKRGTEYVVLRVSNPYGGTRGGTRKNGAVDAFVARHADRQPITLWGSGDTVRDFVHVDDVVEALVHAMDRAPAGSAFNVGSGEATRLDDLLALLGEVSGRAPDVRREPSRDFDVPANVLAIGRYAEATGWMPRIALAEGVARTWREALARRGPG